MNEQVYYIEQWRDPYEDGHFAFEKYKNFKDLQDGIYETFFADLITVAYFRIKLKDKK